MASPIANAQASGLSMLGMYCFTTGIFRLASVFTITAIALIKTFLPSVGDDISAPVLTCDKLLKAKTQQHAASILFMGRNKE